MTGRLIQFPAAQASSPSTVVDVMVDTQVAIRRLRRELAPIVVAVNATRDWQLMSDCGGLADHLMLAQRVSRRMAGRAEVLAGKACACGETGPGHGRAVSA